MVLGRQQLFTENTLWVIIIITYLVGLAGFSHIIAGSVDVMFGALTHRYSWSDYFAGFMLPALLGNIVGGVALVAAIAPAQIAAGSSGTDV